MSEVVKDSIWSKGGLVVFVKNIVEGMGGLEEENYAVITNGQAEAVIPCDSLQGGWDNVTDDMEPMTWHHVVSMSAGNEDETMQMLDLMSLQSMEICSQGAVPFEVVDEERVGNVKEHRTEFANACGYWERAYAQLNTEEDKDGERNLVIQVILYGKLFTSQFQDMELNEDNIGELVTVTPQFSNNLGDDDVLSAVSFDLRKL